MKSPKKGEWLQNKGYTLLKTVWEISMSISLTITGRIASATLKLINLRYNVDKVNDL